MARSPSYPQFPLPKCISLLKMLYESAHRATVDSQTAIEALGYSPRSGSGLGALSSLKQFALVEGRDESISITGLGLTLLEPMNDSEYHAAYRSAALSPVLFLELYQLFDESSPSEPVLRSMAVRKYEFTSTGAEKLFRSFSETISHIKKPMSIDDGRGTNVSSDETQLPGNGASVENGIDDRNADTLVSLDSTMSDQSVTKLQFPLSTDCTAVVHFQGPVTQRVINKLIGHLQLSLDIYPKEEL